MRSTYAFGHEPRREPRRDVVVAGGGDDVVDDIGAPRGRVARKRSKRLRLHRLRGFPRVRRLQRRGVRVAGRASLRQTTRDAPRAATLPHAQPVLRAGHVLVPGKHRSRRRGAAHALEQARARAKQVIRRRVFRRVIRALRISAVPSEPALRPRRLRGLFRFLRAPGHRHGLLRAVALPHGRGERDVARGGGGFRGGRGGFRARTLRRRRLLQRALRGRLGIRRRLSTRPRAGRNARHARALDAVSLPAPPRDGARRRRRRRRERRRAGARRRRLLRSGARVLGGGARGSFRSLQPRLYFRAQALLGLLATQTPLLRDASADRRVHERAPAERRPGDGGFARRPRARLILHPALLQLKRGARRRPRDASLSFFFRVREGGVSRRVGALGIAFRTRNRSGRGSADAGARGVR